MDGHADPQATTVRRTAARGGGLGRADPCRRDGGRNLPLAGWEWAAALTSWLGYVGLLLAAGGVFFLAVVHDGREDERRLITKVIVAAAILAFVARVAAEPVRAIQISGQGLQAVVDSSAYRVTLRTSDGWSGLVRLVGLALLMVGVVRRPRMTGREGARARPGLALALTGAVAAVASASLAGHTVSAEPQWLVRPADVAHMLAGAVWFGGLVALGMVLRRRWGDPDPHEGGAVVARFSGWATVSLALVTVAGVSIAWAEARTLSALLDSDYGIVLLVKIALVVGVAAIGAYNNRRLVPAIRRASETDTDGTQAWRLLGRTVRIEASALVVVLAVTGTLVHVAPPRPFAQEQEHEARSDDGDDGLQAEVVSVP